ncbi:hypothetical protein T261_4424 [Streptomyces lydicus]|nr:hypothetical protein T261_4424 [Streptomyces lydicus]
MALTTRADRMSTERAGCLRGWRKLQRSGGRRAGGGGGGGGMGTMGLRKVLGVLTLHLGSGLDWSTWGGQPPLIRPEELSQWLVGRRIIAG